MKDIAKSLLVSCFEDESYTKQFGWFGMKNYTLFKHHRHNFLPLTLLQARRKVKQIKGGGVFCSWGRREGKGGGGKRKPERSQEAKTAAWVSLKALTYQGLHKGSNEITVRE